MSTVPQVFNKLLPLERPELGLLGFKDLLATTCTCSIKVTIVIYVYKFLLTD
jgi:hypothetical protein